VTWKDIKKISSEKKNKRMYLFGVEGNYLSLGLVVSYLDEADQLVLRNLLVLNKRSHEMLRMPVYK
jgi:hypothetical protein